MKFKYCLIFLIVIMLSSCGSGIDITTDRDNTVDFHKFKTYAYTFRSMELSQDQSRRERIIAAIDREMRKMGYTKASNPDVFLDIYSGNKAEEFLTGLHADEPAPTRSFSWSPGFRPDEDFENEFDTGTIFVNLIDAREGFVVWQGRISGLSDNIKTDEKIDPAVSEMFTKFPH